MSAPQSSEFDDEKRPREAFLLKGTQPAGRSSPGQSLAQAMGMVDILVAIKIDLTAEVLPALGEVGELRERVHRACGAIEVAIAELKTLTAVTAVEKRDMGRDVDREPFSR